MPARAVAQGAGVGSTIRRGSSSHKDRGPTRAWGRPKSHRWQHQHGDPPAKPGYTVTATGVSHCGAGCTLGDIIAEFAVFGLGAT